MLAPARMKLLLRAFLPRPRDDIKTVVKSPCGKDDVEVVRIRGYDGNQPLRAFYPGLDKRLVAVGVALHYEVFLPVRIFDVFGVSLYDHERHRASLRVPGR